MLTKQERRDWFYGLTDEQRNEYIEKTMVIRAEKRVNYPKNESNCPIFPVITFKNRKIWQNKVLRLNPWLDPEVFAV